MGDVPCSALDIGEPELLEFTAQNFPVARQLLSLAGRDAVENLSRALDVRAEKLDQLGTARKPVQTRDIVERFWLRRDQVAHPRLT